MTKAVKAGDTIAVDYTGKHEDGKVFDTSKGRGPLEFTVGSGMMIKGFDTAVLGMEKGESKTVVIPPEQGYGQRDDKAFVDLPKAGMPDDMPLTEGMQVQLEDPEGRPVLATISKIREESVTMDLNHFLAGKTLTFDITISETGLTPKANEAHQCGCSGDSESEGCGCSSDSKGCSDKDGCGCGC